VLTFHHSLPPNRSGSFMHSLAVTRQMSILSYSHPHLTLPALSARPIQQYDTLLLFVFFFLSFWLDVAVIIFIIIIIIIIIIVIQGR
jgi:hypothetical protein